GSVRWIKHKRSDACAKEVTAGDSQGAAAAAHGHCPDVVGQPRDGAGRIRAAINTKRAVGRYPKIARAQIKRRIAAEGKRSTAELNRGTGGKTQRGVGCNFERAGADGERSTQIVRAAESKQPRALLLESLGAEDRDLEIDEAYGRVATKRTHVDRGLGGC